MIGLIPDIEASVPSPYGGTVRPRKILWHGLHVCVEGECSETGKTIIADLPVGHALQHPCQVDPAAGEVFCKPEVRSWLGLPLLHSLQHPVNDDVPFTIERLNDAREVIILDCIDTLYGHSLLKLLNAERHLREHPNLGLIVIIQDFLRWLVPDGVAEVWTVGIPLKRGGEYFPSLGRTIEEQLRRFSRVYVSKALSHPRVQDIRAFTRTEAHSDSSEPFRITWIWRSDRLWIPDLPALVAKKAGLTHWFAGIQTRKVVRLFRLLRKDFPNARFTVAGIGKGPNVPEWIEDHRIASPSQDDERRVCRTYSESRLVVGVHGSNMLLPSAHAGMTVDLMPPDRWGNLGQDSLAWEPDSRVSLYRNRFLPLSISVRDLADIVRTQIQHFQSMKKHLNP